MCLSCWLRLFLRRESSFVFMVVAAIFLLYIFYTGVYVFVCVDIKIGMHYDEYIAVILASLRWCAGCRAFTLGSGGVVDTCCIRECVTIE